MADIFNRARADYQAAIEQINQRGDATEHSFRTPFETLFRSLLSEPSWGITHEPGQQKGLAPDFRITKDGATVGFVECKRPGADLDSLATSDQIKNYSSLCGNILLTDYYKLLLLRDGREAGQAVLAEGQEFTDLIEQHFASVAPTGIDTAPELAEALARRARLLQGAISQELGRSAHARRLAGLFASMRELVSAEFTVAEFADTMAQMLPYALLMGRLNPDCRENLSLHNIRQFVPVQVGLIAELADFLYELENGRHPDFKWLIEEVLAIINSMNREAIWHQLSFASWQGNRGWRGKDEHEAQLFLRDPFIYFYEDFLAAYDPELREGRGVYYTPPPVVSYIIGAVDEVLQTVFGLEDGLADHRRVTILDFACGTGTFLLEIFIRILDRKSSNKTVVRDEHLLRNIYGFELLIAPYVIAHMKLGMYLAEQQIPIPAGQRLGVYLANTLEPPGEIQESLFLPALTAEAKAAAAIKESPILVITGNQPYSGHSMNRGDWIKEMIEDYKKVNDQPIDEANPKWLQDDYVKFIRFAQWKMDQLEEGVVALITNHAFLFNPTFRGMRSSLMASFDQVHILDLHGNARRRETSPDGGTDQNVFQIMQGVAITLLIKKPGLEKGVFHRDLWGSQRGKFDWLARTNHTACAGDRLWPERTPFWMFVPIDLEKWARYATGKSLKEIFLTDSVGIVTARDKLLIQPDRETAKEVFSDFAGLDVEVARRKYNLGRDTRDWKVHLAQQEIKKTGTDPKRIVPVNYRPFDTRWTYYTPQSKGILCMPRGEIMRHMLAGENLGLVGVRQVASDNFSHCWIVNGLVDIRIMASSEGGGPAYLFPLWLYHGDGSGRDENFRPDFRRWLDEKYRQAFPPEQILGYLYAILHSPAHRAEFIDFLKFDFARIPFWDNAEDFTRLAELGSQLMDLHLLRTAPASPRPIIDGKNEDNLVSNISYSAADQKILINKTRWFSPVEQPVWDFHIGGYQVLKKWLDGRKGRALTLNECEHFCQVAAVLADTRAKMIEIDQLVIPLFSQP